MSIDIPVPLLAAFVGGLVGGLFSLLLFALVRKKEDRTRREQAALDHIQRQIEELYGPLLGLLQRNRIVFIVARSRLMRSGRLQFHELSNEEKKLWLFFNDSYLIPTNTEISKLLQAKSFLLDSLEPPPSISQFAAHAIQYELVNRTWQSTGVDASFIDHVAFPKTIESDVEAKLTELRALYRDYLHRLTASPKNIRPRS